MEERTLSGGLIAFDCEWVEVPPGTVAAPRPPHQPRELDDETDATGTGDVTSPGMTTYEGVMHPVPPGTMARPRPAGRERPMPTDEPSPG